MQTRARPAGRQCLTNAPPTSQTEHPTFLCRGVRLWRGRAPCCRGPVLIDDVATLPEYAAVGSCPQFRLATASPSHPRPAKCRPPCEGEARTGPAAMIGSSCDRGWPLRDSPVVRREESYARWRPAVPRRRFAREIHRATMISPLGSLPQRCREWERLGPLCKAAPYPRYCTRCRHGRTTSWISAKMASSTGACVTVSVPREFG